MNPKKHKLHIRKKELQEELESIRRQLIKIENLEKKKEIDKIIGTCYKGGSRLHRIERFDFSSGYYYGTTITSFGEGQDLCVKIEANASIFYESFDEDLTKEIYETEFLEKLEDVKKIIAKL